MTTPPILETIAEALYEELTPLAHEDYMNGYALAIFCAALGEMFQIVDDLGRDQIDVNGNVLEGWSQLMDINRTPTIALPWLAQFVGVTVDSRLSDADQRNQIKSVSGWSRGTVNSLRNAPAPYLTGTKTVIFRERDPAACASDPAYGLTVITYASETTDSAAVLAALMAQKPAGIILRYVTATGQDYQSLLTNHPTYANVYSSYTSYQGVVSDTPGT